MNAKKMVAPLMLALSIVLAATPAFAFEWDYTWDDPVLYNYCLSYDCYGGQSYGGGQGSGSGYGSGYTNSMFNRSYYGGYYGGNYGDYGIYNTYSYPAQGNQYANAYQAYQPMMYQSQYQSTYQAQYQPTYQPQSYGYGQPNIGSYGYGQQAGYQSYGFSNGTPTGDTIPYLNEPLCDYPGYGRYSCLYHPAQPLYDYWTGTWY